jgi:hypothetical protein
MPVGMFCLAAAILFSVFVHSASQLSRSWFEGLRGFLFGVSAGFNLMAVRRRSRDRRSVENQIVLVSHHRLIEQMESFRSFKSALL